MFIISCGISSYTSNYGVKAMATAWAPSVSIKAGSIEICFQLNVGSIGAQAGYFADKGFSVGFSYGWGVSVGVKWGN